MKKKKKKNYREELLINGELNPKLDKILKEWYDLFTEGEKKMYPKGIAEFIKGVSNNKEDVDEDESRVKDFLKKHDKDNKGYVSEEEFIGFYKEALKDKKHVVWKNLKMMDIREDLTKKDEPFDIKYFENEKLPRYQLGNDIEFIKSIIKQYYKNPKTNYILIEFLMFLTTKC